MWSIFDFKKNIIKIPCLVWEIRCAWWLLFRVSYIHIIIYIYYDIYAHAIAIWWPPKGVKNSTGWVWKNSLPPWIYEHPTNCWVDLAVKIGCFPISKGRKSAKNIDKNIINDQNWPISLVFCSTMWDIRSNGNLTKSCGPEGSVGSSYTSYWNLNFWGEFENSWNLSGYPSPIADLHKSVNHNTSKWEHLEAYHASMG